MSGLSKVLLDSDTLSFYFKNSPKIVANAQKYLQEQEVFTFSIVTRFEILRGMKVRNASAQLKFFDLFCLQNEVIGLNDEIIIKATDIYADLHRRGQIIGDADILIAATAIVNNLTIITNNEKHFSRILDLRVLNWNR